MTGEKKLLERLGGILCSSVAVEDEAGAGRPFRIRLSERRRDQFGAGDSGYSVGDDFSGKQVQNDGDVIVLAFHLVAGDVADSDLVGPFRSEVLVKGARRRTLRA